MKKKITLNYKRRKIGIIAEDCNLWKKFSGLMFSRREKAKILLFRFNKKQKMGIHSLFVFFPFIALWFDDKNKIIDMKIIKPFTFIIYPKEPASGLVEIPITEKNKKLIKSVSIFSPSEIRKI